MAMPPRFDPSTNDPMGLKPQLVHLYNSHYSQFWKQSQLRDKIVICDHNIPRSLGSDHLEVFGHPDDPHYNGVHLRGHHGQQCMTKSVLNVLSSAKLRPTPTPRTEDHASRYDPLQMWRKSIRSQPLPRQVFHHQSSPQTAASKPDSVVIEIPDDCYSYSVPTFNLFEVLGN